MLNYLKIFKWAKSTKQAKVWLCRDRGQQAGPGRGLEALVCSQSEAGAPGNSLRSPIPGESPSWPSHRVLCAPETVPCAPRAAGGAKSAVSSGHDSSPARSGPHSTTSTNVSSHVILQKTELEGQTGQGFDDECHH